MKRLILAILASLFLAACTQFSYSKPDANPQQFAADQSQCNTQANVASAGTGGFMGVAIFKQNKDMCMVGKGYTTMCDGKPCNPQY